MSNVRNENFKTKIEEQKSKIERGGRLPRLTAEKSGTSRIEGRRLGTRPTGYSRRKEIILSTRTRAGKSLHHFRRGRFTPMTLPPVAGTRTNIVGGIFYIQPDQMKKPEKRRKRLTAAWLGDSQYLAG